MTDNLEVWNHAGETLNDKNKMTSLWHLQTIPHSGTYLKTSESSNWFIYPATFNFILGKEMESERMDGQNERGRMTVMKCM